MFGVKFEDNLMHDALNQLVESPMDPRYRNTHLKLLDTSFLSFLGILVIFRNFGMNKKGVFVSFLSFLLPNR